MVDFITLCSKNGMVLNPEKFKFGVSETDFAGFRVSHGEVKPMESHVEAIKNFPEPKNMTDMRSFMAMCEQVSYAARIKDDLLPFWDLLKNNGKNFFWDAQSLSIFKKIRNKISKACMAGIKSFDPNLITTLREYRH